MAESTIDLLTKDFKKLFKPFLRSLKDLKFKYGSELGQELFEATIEQAARELEKEIKR